MGTALYTNQGQGRGQTGIGLCQLLQAQGIFVLYFLPGSLEMSLRDAFTFSSAAVTSPDLLQGGGRPDPL